MKTTLATFMKLGVTALIIGALIFGAALSRLTNESDKYRTHLRDGLNSVIEAETTP